MGRRGARYVLVAGAFCICGKEVCLCNKHCDDLFLNGWIIVTRNIC